MKTSQTNINTVIFLALLFFFIPTVYGSTVIEPTQGGEVASEDGRARLIIPAQALEKAALISVSTESDTSLKEARPSSTELIAAVRLEPAGLEFKKEAILILRLFAEEIPGTPVQLGLYDDAQHKIVYTGQVSRVNQDGTSATFALRHFSTYAALKQVADQGRPIGASVQIPLPDMLTGAFSHSIGLSVPPGRKGIQPNLSLTYRCVNPNSSLGVGWCLEPGYIVRSTRLRPPTYDDRRDTFVLITPEGSTELVNLIGNLYQSKVEASFTKFYKEPDDTWRAVEKNGLITVFGTTENAREKGSGGTFSWHISRATDTNGNYIDFFYSQDQGKSYLTRIEYTGNSNTGFSPTHSVDFTWEARQDTLSNFLSGTRIITAKRLREIQASIQGEPVARCLFTYNYSLDTGRSLLSGLMVESAEGAEFPAQRFYYQKVERK